MLDYVTNAFQRISPWHSSSITSTSISRSTSTHTQAKPHKHPRLKRSISAPISQPSSSISCLSTSNKRQSPPLPHSPFKRHRSSISQIPQPPPIIHHESSSHPDSARYDPSILLFRDLPLAPELLTPARSSSNGTENLNTVIRVPPGTTVTQKPTVDAKLLYENDRVAYYQYAPRNRDETKSQPDQNKPGGLHDASRDKWHAWSNTSVLDLGSLFPSPYASPSTVPLHHSERAPNETPDEDEDADPSDLIRTRHLHALLASLKFPAYIASLGTSMSRRQLAALFAWLSACQLRMSLGEVPATRPTGAMAAVVAGDCGGESSRDAMAQGSSDARGILKTPVIVFFADWTMQEQIDWVVDAENRKRVSWGGDETRYYEVEVDGKDEKGKVTGLRRKGMKVDIVGDLIEFD